AFVERRFPEYTIPDIDYVARYSFTVLDEIRKFPGFENDGLRYVEQEYRINPSMTKKEVESIRKNRNTDVESIELKFNVSRDDYNKLLSICNENNLSFYDLIIKGTIEMYQN
ncbi:MAG: hypothetical protein K6F37_07210, partial [Lachnospiraceae bacterium]|nr:hypothetical protein [Lachnospiraceae bacterium]